MPINVKQHLDKMVRVTMYNDTTFTGVIEDCDNAKKRYGSEIKSHRGYCMHGYIVDGRFTPRTYRGEVICFQKSQIKKIEVLE